MQISQLAKGTPMALVVVAIISGLCLSGISAMSTHSNDFKTGETHMNTKIAVLGSNDALDEFAGEDAKKGLTIVDPASILNNSQVVAKLDDIEEDPKDPFVTTRSGKRRPMIVESEEWADEAPMAKMPRRILSRVKRCGDDDDGDANRSRRSRRARRTRRARRARTARRRAAKAERKAAATTTTTVTRKVIQNGQVISQTTEGGPVVASSQHQQPAAATTVVHQPAVAQAPVVVHQQPVPSISVQGSIQVN